MTTPFIDRPPTSLEIQKFRLIMSTYQDGTGQLAVKQSTLPGWRDFERSIALAFGGIAQENKFVFDVLIPDPTTPAVYFGLSCKMRGTLNETRRTGRVTIELSNSSGKFWDALASKNINQRNYRLTPETVGTILLETVASWHQSATPERGGTIDTKKSFYLALSWNKSGQYQLTQFPLNLPNPRTLRWEFPPKKVKGRTVKSRHLVGYDGTGKIIEWYGESGGQLKYYPIVTSALWSSEPFQLEPLPSSGDQGYGILSKAAAYFPAQWRKIEAQSS